VPVFAKQISLFDPLGQIAEMKDRRPARSSRTLAFPICSAATSSRATYSAASSPAPASYSSSRRSRHCWRFRFGVALGLPAGYFGRRIDALL